MLKTSAEMYFIVNIALFFACAVNWFLRDKTAVYFSGKVGNVPAAVAANKTVFLRALRTALFSALCANAVVVDVYFLVAAGTNHIFHLCNKFPQTEGFSNVKRKT